MVLCREHNFIRFLKREQIKRTGDFYKQGILLFATRLVVVVEIINAVFHSSNQQCEGWNLLTIQFLKVFFNFFKNGIDLWEDSNTQSANEAEKSSILLK